ncbi:MAG: hypothetical protein NVS3B25_00460 [Hymenobacter sp.]
MYHQIFHPYRLPTPKLSPEFKAQQKAKKKNGGFLAFGHRQNKKGKATDTSGEEAATDVSTPTGGTIARPAGPPAEARPLPEHSTVKYDKHQMLKKPKLKRRRLHKPAKGFHPWQSIRNFFKYGRHAKPDYSPDHRPAPHAPDTDPVPAPAPAPAPKPPLHAVPAPAPASPAPKVAPGIKP